MPVAQFNNLPITSFGRVAVIFANNSFVIQGLDRIKFRVDDSTSISDLSGNPITFTDLKINSVVTVSPVLSSLAVASKVLTLPDPDTQ